MKTNHRKVKSYVALLTAVACMATGTASLSASAVNSAVTGTNISQKQTQKLSETVYTFSSAAITVQCCLALKSHKLHLTHFCCFYYNKSK